jgi:Protein of unknown function (DUF1573)
MRHLVYLFAFCFLISSCEKSAEPEQKEVTPQADSTALANETPADTANMAKMKFEESEFDFGTIKEGDVVKHVFKFTNVGATDLIISDARGSCGCTIPSYPKEPIAVGASGEILVEFNSKNKAGANQKFVSIVANTYPEVTTISIKANVDKKDESTGPLAN